MVILQLLHVMKINTLKAPIIVFDVLRNNGNIITPFNFIVKFITEIIILKNTNTLGINLTVNIILQQNHIYLQ